MCDAIWNKKKQHTFNEPIKTLKDISVEMSIPNTHCSERILLPSGLLPLYFPMQIPACRTVLHTVPPQSSISSTRLWAGGWECWDTNIGGWLWNRSCWCSPADRCLCRRQIWEEKWRAKYSFHLRPTDHMTGLVKMTIWKLLLKLSEYSKNV